MRVAFCLALALTLGGCASHVRPLGNQPAIKSGTTVIAIALVPAASGGGCRAKVSRERAQVRVNRPVVWEVIDVCNESEQDIELRFDEAGGVKDNLRAVKGKGKVRRGQPDYLQWDVTTRAKPEQYADYGIYLGQTKLDDPRHRGAEKVSPAGAPGHGFPNGRASIPWASVLLCVFGALKEVEGT